MRKHLSAFGIICSAVFLFTGCSPQPGTLKESVSESADKLLNTLNFQGTMVPIDRSAILGAFNLDDSEVKDAKVYLCKNTTTTEEIAVFEGYDAMDVDAINSGVSYRNYNVIRYLENLLLPKQERYDLLHYAYAIRGNFVVYCVNRDCAGAQKAVDALFTD